MIVLNLVRTIFTILTIIFAFITFIPFQNLLLANGIVSFSELNETTRLILYICMISLIANTAFRTMFKARFWYFIYGIFKIIFSIFGFLFRTKDKKKRVYTATTVKSKINFKKHNRQFYEKRLPPEVQAIMFKEIQEIPVVETEPRQSAQSQPHH